MVEVVSNPEIAEWMRKIKELPTIRRGQFRRRSVG
jgi:hypothetical protein